MLNTNILEAIENSNQEVQNRILVSDLWSSGFELEDGEYYGVIESVSSDDGRHVLIAIIIEDINYKFRVKLDIKNMTVYQKAWTDYILARCNEFVGEMEGDSIYFQVENKSYGEAIYTNVTYIEQCEDDEADVVE